MGRGIIKLSDGKESWYLEWSTIVDAPVTYGMSLDELREYVKEEDGANGLAALPQRLERVEKCGTSFHGDESALDTAWLNRAGKDETALTYTQILAKYCAGSDAPDVVGQSCDCEDDCEHWSFEKFDDRAKLSGEGKGGE